MTLNAHIAALESLGLIRPVPDSGAEAEYRFRHALVHDAAYTTMLRQDRRRLHQAVGEVLERDPTERDSDLEPILGRHFFEAGDLDRASTYFGRAAASAARKFAHAEAISYFSQAIDAALAAAENQTRQRLAGLYQGRARVYELQGDFEAARADYECAADAARTAGSQPDEWQALLGLALLWSQRDYERAGEYCHQALALAQQMGEPNLLARSYNRVGNWHLNLLQPREAADYHQQALEIFQSVQDETGMAETLDLLGMTNMIGSRLGDGARFYQQAIDLNRRRGDKLALANVLTGQLLTGNTAFQTLTLRPSPLAGRDLLPQGEQALQLVRESGFRPGEAFTNFVLSNYAASRGNYTRGLSAVREGLAIATSIGHRQWLAASYYGLGIINLDLLALATAIAHLQTGFAYSRQIASRHWIAVHTGVLAQAWLEVGEVEQAAQLLDSAGNLRHPPQAIGERVIVYSRALLAAARGQLGDALAELTELFDSLEAAAPDQPQTASPRMHLTRGDLYAGMGRGEAARADYQIGLAGAEAYGERPSLWRLHAALSRFFAAQGQPAQAQAHRIEGLQVVAALGAEVPEPELRATFLSEAERRFAAA